jgi:hypothetical protein
MDLGVYYEEDVKKYKKKFGRESSRKDVAW